jgi:hypothetical protein
VHLLIAIAALLISSPFVQDLTCGRVVEGVLFTVVLLSALFAVSARRAMVAGIFLAGLALGAQWLSFFIVAFRPVSMAAAAVFIALVIVRLVLHVLSADEVNQETLCACISGFLLIGLMWTAIYSLLATLDPKAFSFAQPGQTMDGFEAFYYSFVTLSTIGFGDITPASRVARMLSVMEAVTGMFYVAVLVARLVSIYSSAPKSNSSPNSLR